MSIKTFKSVAPILASTTSICLTGIHGIGKSSLGRWLRKELQRSNPDLLGEFPLIDRRLSQQTSGDLIGLPSTKGDVTKFNPPDWFKMACDRPCFLLLDELNRALPEVMQAAFQIVLDRELNGWRLHPETRVMTGVNNSGSYTVEQLDPALIDRFWFVNLVATVEDWIDWAEEKPEEGSIQAMLNMTTNIDRSIIDFISQNSNWLDPFVDDDPTFKGPSRRSWERCSNDIVKAKLINFNGQQNEKMLYALCQGYVGLEAAIAYTQYVSDKHGKFTGRDVIENFDKFKHILVDVGTERRNSTIEQMVKYLFELDDRQLVDDDGKRYVLTQEQKTNIKKFVELLEENNDGELIVSFWKKTVQDGEKRLVVAQDLHPIIGQNVVDVFLRAKNDKTAAAASSGENKS